jgi:hypothetical protein
VDQPPPSPAFPVQAIGRTHQFIGRGLLYVFAVNRIEPEMGDDVENDDGS